MDIKPPKKVKNFDFVKNPDIRKVKQVSSSLKPKTPKIISESQINQKIKEKVVAQVGEKKSPKRLKLGIFIGFILFLFVCSLYFINIQNFHPVSSFDKVVLEKTRSLDAISDNILFAPKKTLDLLLFKAGLSIELSAKLVSATLTLVATVLYFILVRQWVSFKITILSTILFSSSSWIIFQARDPGFGSTLLMAIPVLLLSAVLINKKKGGFFAYIISILLALSLYTPGFVWLIILGTVFYFKNIRSYFKSITRFDRAVVSLLFLLPILPLAYFLSKSMDILKTWLGIPANFAVKDMLTNFVDLPQQLLYKGVDNPSIWLQSTPVLDAVTLILLLTGFVYIFNRDRYSNLKKSTLIFSLVAVALIVLNGYEYISILLPLLYLLVAVGLTFLVEQWFHIFPRNPFARAAGLSLVVFLVFLVSSYGVIRYFVAWPRAEATKAIFSSSQSVTIVKETKE